MGRHEGQALGEQQALLSPPGPSTPLAAPRGLFATQRPARDVLWAWLWALSMAGVVAGAVYAFNHRNPDFATLISPAYLKDASHCPAAGPRRRLLAAGDAPAEPTFFYAAAGLCTALSIAGGGLLALASLYLFKRSPQGMVKASVAIQISIPAALALAAFVAGAPAAGAPFALMAGLLALTVWLYREQLTLVGRLLSISVHALSDQPGIVAAALGLQLLGLLVLLPLAGMMLLAITNGQVVPNPSRASVGEGGACLDGAGSEVACCSWEVDGWVPGYLAYSGLIATWTTLLVFTVKMYTIAGATAQWYFAPVAQGPPKGATLLSARHALGPSFGSLCLASWLLTLIKYARAALDKIRQDNEGGVCVFILTSCLDFLYALFEAVTRFGVVRAAITGEAFMDACHGAVDLLARNLLDTVGVWWLPGLILQTTAFMMSVAWGLLTYGASTAWWGGGRAAVASGALVGVLSGVFALIVLAFINSVLLNMVDAVYVAWAMDRDAAAVTRSDVHAVFASPGAPWIKAPGAIIEQPDTNLAYGAEQAAPAPGRAPGYPVAARV